MAIEASQEFVNKYVERQQRAIADLMNKVVLLETQLAMATDRIKALEANQKEETKDADFASSEIKAE
jgi:predicted  nucleic acid-binding Zn-ribbon protein